MKKCGKKKAMRRGEVQREEEKEETRKAKPAEREREDERCREGRMKRGQKR